MIGTALHLIFLLALPPLLLGVINKTKAGFAGRTGPPWLQAYHDIFKLLRKELVLSRTTTWIFRAAPAVSLAAIGMAGLMLPFCGREAPLSFAGDAILFVYLFALARFFTTAAALDTGSAFEGMGAAREVTFACLTEPALFFALLVLARVSGSVSLSGMLSGTVGADPSAAAPLVLAAMGLFVVMLAESCRIPVDDPNTHLELTMIHEVMVLDHGGPLLGLILYAASLKLFLLGALLVRVIAPAPGGTPWLDGPAFALEMVLLAAAVGVVESVMARLRMQHVPYLLVAGTLSCGFGFLLMVR